MKPIAMFERKSLATALVLAGTIGFAGTLLAQYPQEQAKPAATPQAQEQAKPAGATPDPQNQAKPAAAAPQSGAMSKEAMAEKPIIPSKAETADAAFKKLDAAGKGYVTKEDTKGLTGFDNAFQLADASGNGKLDATQFKKAWESYTGRKG